MEPEKKAKSIVRNYLRIGCTQADAIQYALICVKEILQFGNQVGVREPLMYWEKVKQEIRKLEQLVDKH